MKEKYMKNLNKKQGISLIVLIMTIIVIIILATAVIQSFSNNNPIEKAKEATFKNDVKTMQEELEMAKLNTYFEENPKDITIGDLKTAKNKYEDKFAVTNGEIRYIKTKLTSDEIKWVQELGLEKYAYTLKNGEYGVTIEGNQLTTDWKDNNIPKEIGTDIIIPEGIEVISERAFEEVEFESITIPNTVKRIEGMAFYNGKINGDLVIPEGVEVIGDSVFNGCEIKGDVIIPGSAELGSFSFVNIKASNVILHNGITDIIDTVFASANLASITLPNTLISIGSEVFSGCKIPSITIPASVERIDHGNFNMINEIIIEGEPRFDSDDAYQWFHGDKPSSITISGPGYITE